AFYETWKPLLDGVSWIVSVVDKITEIHPYAQMAWSVLKVIPQAIVNQAQADTKVQKLLELMKNRAHEAAARYDHEADPRQATIISRIMEQVVVCGDIISSYSETKSFWMRATMNVVRPADKAIDECTDALIRLRDALRDRGVELTNIRVLRIVQVLDDVSEKIDDLSRDEILKELPYKQSSAFDPGAGCLPNTRVAFLHEISAWVNTPIPSPRMLVLFGRAGTGKSAIAHEIAHRFYDANRLTTSLFFIHSPKKDSKPRLLVTNLIRDLCDRHPSFKRAVGDALSKDPYLRHGAPSCGAYFEFLIHQLDNLRPLERVFVVIDALDEAGDQEQRKDLLDSLSEYAPRLPDNFRIFLTSRPEEDIVESLRESDAIRVLHMDNPILASTRNDVHEFVKSHLGGCVDASEWGKLASAAGELFQWAAVACKVVGPRALRSRTERINMIIRGEMGTALDKLDSLYFTILSDRFPDPDDTSARRFRFVMSMILGCIDPPGLSQDSLTVFAQFTPPDPQAAIQDIQPKELIQGVIHGLGSLISNVDDRNSHLPLSLLHQSIREFLTSERRSGVYFVDISNIHNTLSHACLKILLDSGEGLRFNICDLETSHRRNTDIPDLDSIVQKHIPGHLRYASLNWDLHLIRAPCTAEFGTQVKRLLKDKLLFWLEILSLTGHMKYAVQALGATQKWLSVSCRNQPVSASTETDQQLMELLKDSLNFLWSFGSVIAQSAAHIYISALPFSPFSSVVSRTYRSSFGRILSIKDGRAPRTWPASQLMIPAHDLGINCVAFSPDGEHIFSGSSDCTIRVWDAATGEAVAGPFAGHTKPIRSIALSPPGGALIASGSDDQTIRVRDTKTGEETTAPFKGHTAPVQSVAFSHDGKQIVSGSDDSTVLVWDATTGHVVQHFVGHTASVQAVAFSPDGKRVVSGSEDCTVRIWEDVSTDQHNTQAFAAHTAAVRAVAFAPSGSAVASASDDGTICLWDTKTGQASMSFNGHEDYVRSIAFSREGSRIASGSWDRSVIVWDTETGKVIAGPFEGHTDFVRSVAFSPDGHRVVSGSEDCTIRVWDVTAGETASEALSPGHDDWVRSVAFSPEGDRIVSGSDDGTLCVWNAMTGKAITGPFKAHDAWIRSVVFSPDGARIVSGSVDGTIRVWDVMTGKEVVKPLQGHTDWVQSVALSPTGEFIASGSSDRTIRLWHAMSGESASAPFEGHTDSIRTVAFSPDGKRIASGGNDHTIRIWDVASGATVVGPLTGHTDTVRTVTFSPDGVRLVSCANDSTIRLWDARTGAALGRPIRGHTNWVRCATFSPDGTRMVSGADDRTIRIWDATTRELVAGPFGDHTGGVLSATFSPDGQRVLSSSADYTIRMTNVAPVGGDTEAWEAAVTAPDGWIRGADGELLCWVPEGLRTSLRGPRTVFVISTAGTVELDRTHFVHGTRWAEC
ncbi:hypothetical protein K488DRAFT_32940, partial [Vararia minispora EC-137]